ncbi:uncharacterized protein LOC141607654 [Silene latifolia]|uniref:uncharacterized protein LOC141607654 n=1 Tax=Silene latifolia TaxID=37657 RepID=UPI003D77EDCA
MDDFIRCWDVCGMTDTHSTGAYFTWNNKEEPLQRKYSRLDRFLINQEWLSKFPDMRAHFHLEGLLHHNPYIINNVKIGGHKKASFTYFNMWGAAPFFLARVGDEWYKSYLGTKMFVIIKKLKALKNIIKELNKECFSDIELQVNIVAHELENIQKQIVQDPTNLTLIATEQKAKAQWLEEWDSNTTYFHGAIKQRCLRNKVIQIEDQRGRLCKDGDNIQDAFLDYYQTLLGSRKDAKVVKPEVLNQGKCCETHHLDILNRPATNEEINQVIFSVPPDKSHVPHGYTNGFFKDAWSIVGQDICAEIQDFFLTGNLLTQINSTNVTLVPKYERPTAVKHFRPIACCNLIYKSISKLLCNRLALVLHDIIHDNQGYLFKKAYDAVEWDFMEQLLKGLEFPKAFIPKVFGSQYTGWQAHKEGMQPDNLVNRIRSLGAKKLFYAGRIERICRNFFWDGSSEYQRVPLLAWDKPESVEHLFFECEYSKRIIALVEHWLHRQLPTVEALIAMGRKSIHWKTLVLDHIDI